MSSTSPKAPSLLIPIIGMILFTFLAAFLAAYLTFRPPSGDTANAIPGRTPGFGTTSDFYEKFPLPDFNLTTAGGTPISKQDMLGKVWAADFIFTRCPGPCPVITRNFSMFQQLLPSATADGPGFALLTFTVDPEHDTPAVLAEYGKNFNANPAKWNFVTGPKADLYNFIWNGFKVVAKENDAEGNIPMQDKFLHSTKVALVDKEGNVRGYYEGFSDGKTDDTKEWQKLRNDMLRLSKE